MIDDNEAYPPVVNNLHCMNLNSISEYNFKRIPNDAQRIYLHRLRREYEEADSIRDYYVRNGYSVSIKPSSVVIADQLKIIDSFGEGACLAANTKEVEENIQKDLYRDIIKHNEQYLISAKFGQYGRDTYESNPMVQEAKELIAKYSAML